MSATDFCPGPTNQKLVPGPWHDAVARPPAAVCSASSPCAIAPLAWIITPPLAGPFGTPDPGVRSGARVAFRVRPVGATFTSASWSVFVRTCRGAGVVTEPAGVRRAICASPVPEEAAASATPAAVAPPEPGAGHARTAADTVAWPGAADRGLASAAG